jgi:hypothetical protein
LVWSPETNTHAPPHAIADGDVGEVRLDVRGHLSATDPRGPLTPLRPFGLFILIELSEWIFLNG